jgi:isopenicillin N synthase-like dioxygenase
MKFSQYLFTTLFCFSSSGITMEVVDKIPSIPILSENMSEEGLRNFAQFGGGYYPIPDNLKILISSTLNEVYSFNEKFKDKAVYAREEKQQIEYVFFEQKDWENHLNEATKNLAEGMNKIAVSILREVLKALHVRSEVFSEATGGLSDFKGKISFKIAHYDHNKKDLPGISWHKDLRWITVLFINEDGLQGRVFGKIIDIKPKDGYFFVNLGVFFEAFINDPNKLTALIHQVKEVNKERISFGVFCNGDYGRLGFFQLKGDSLDFRKKEEMDNFLIKDDDGIFSTNNHKIFHGIDNKI